MENIINSTRENFETQIKEVEQKIATLHNDLEKLKEYKLKLQGGLETLDLIAKETQPEEENIDSKD
jgi:uncharacterized protein Yka (UPF0111/DUF47 family)